MKKTGVGDAVKVLRTLSCLQSLCFEEGLEVCFLLLNTVTKSFQLIFLPLNIVARTKKREKLGDKTSDNDLKIENCTANVLLALSMATVQEIACVHVIRGCIIMNMHKVVECSLHGWPQLWHFSASECLALQTHWRLLSWLALYTFSQDPCCTGAAAQQHH